MNCNCLGEANEKLKEQGTQIAFRFAVRTVKRSKKTVNEMYSAIEIPTRKLNPRQRKPPITLLASHCPMCGKKTDAA